MRAALFGMTFLASVLVGATAWAADAPKCEPEKVAQKYPTLAGKTLIMGADGQSPPYSTVDLKTNLLTGSDIDLAKAVFDCIGLKYEVKTADWSGLFPAIVAGQIDLMYFLYYNETRAKQGDFIVYMKAGTGAVTQKGNPKNIKSEGDLCGKTVAAGLGTVEEAEMKTLGEKCVAEGKETVQVMSSSDQASQFRLIANGRADIVLNDLAFVDKIIADSPTVFERAYSVVSDLQIGIAVKKGNDALAGALLDGLKAVQAAGTQKAIFKKYSIDPALELDAELKTK